MHLSFPDLTPREIAILAALVTNAIGEHCPDARRKASTLVLDGRVVGWDALNTLRNKFLLVEDILDAQSV